MTFGERFKEHLNDPSRIHHHSNNIGHPSSNAQSLRSKKLLLYDNIRENNIEMCIVTETWLQNRDKDKAWCDTSTFNNDKLVLHNINWEACRGGGISLITKSNLTITSLVIDKPSSFEVDKWRVSLQGKNMTDSDIQTAILNKSPNDYCNIH